MRQTRRTPAARIYSRRAPSRALEPRLATPAGTPSHAPASSACSRSRGRPRGREGSAVAYNPIMCQVHTHELQCSSACRPAPCLRRALEGFVGVDVERLQVVQRLKEEAVIIGRVATVYARIFLPTNLLGGRHDIGHGSCTPLCQGRGRACKKEVSKK